MDTETANFRAMGFTASEQQATRTIVENETRELSVYTKQLQEGKIGMAEFTTHMKRLVDQSMADLESAVGHEKAERYKDSLRGMVRNMGQIFGGNNARLYGYTPKMMSEVNTDKVAYYKSLYEKHGGDRSNLVYGYVNKG